MPKIDKTQLAPEVFDLYDKYAHNQLDRRQFVEKLSHYAVGGLTVTAMLNYLLPDYLNKLQVAADDPRLNSEYIEYDSPAGGGTIRGLLSRPAGNSAKLPGVIVVHENRGLNPHIEDVARRAGLANFLALAPDALTPLGGYPGTDDEGRTLQRQRDGEEMVQNFLDAYELLRNHPECSGRVGVVGFCFGGSMSNKLAVRLPELGAAVPFYGGAPDTEEVGSIRAPLLLHFAGLDARVNGTWPDYARALMEADKEFTAHLYPGVNHGFHNDSTPRYDFAAATLAWDRTIDFFNRHLR